MDTPQLGSSNFNKTQTDWELLSHTLQVARLWFMAHGACMLLDCPFCLSLFGTGALAFHGGEAGGPLLSAMGVLHSLLRS